MSENRGIYQVTVVIPHDADPEKFEDHPHHPGDVILEAMCLPGDVPATFIWHYGTDGSILDKEGDLFEVTIRRLQT